MACTGVGVFPSEWEVGRILAETESMFGNQAGSARLQRPPPTHLPHPLAAQNSKDDEEARAERRRLIREHALELCATSPHKRDMKRRHVGPQLWLTRAALIMPMPVYQLHALFEAKHPG